MTVKIKIPIEVAYVDIEEVFKNLSEFEKWMVMDSFVDNLTNYGFSKEGLKKLGDFVKKHRHILFNFDLNLLNYINEYVIEDIFIEVNKCDLSIRVLNCLQAAEITYIGELIQNTEDKLLEIENFGRGSLKEIRNLLTEMDLHLGSKVGNWDQLLLRWKQRHNGVTK